MSKVRNHREVVPAENCLRPLYSYTLKFSLLAQIFRWLVAIQNRDFLAPSDGLCHFDRREKPFLDPSHSLGMTGLGPSLCGLCAFARDMPSFGCVFAAPGSM